MQQDSSDESWLEEQYHREINAQHDEHERELVLHRDSSLSTVWGAFQDSATAVAHLYKERAPNTYSPDTSTLWLPFQTAAGTVTALYKESCDCIRRTSDVALQCGYQRRTRELADWARSKKRRLIRREDLLAYLAGKPPPPNRRSPKPEHSNVSGAGAIVHQSTAVMHAHAHLHGSHAHSHHHQQQYAATNDASNDLHTFKEALILRPRGPELFAFVASEIARHKRPASPIDDKMDGAGHYSSKRQRFM